MRKVLTEINYYDLKLFEYAKSVVAYRLKLITAIVQEVNIVLKQETPQHSGGHGNFLQQIHSSSNPPSVHDGILGTFLHHNAKPSHTISTNHHNNNHHHHNNLHSNASREENIQHNMLRSGKHHTIMSTNNNNELKIQNEQSTVENAPVNVKHLSHTSTHFDKTLHSKKHGLNNIGGGHRVLRTTRNPTDLQIDNDEFNINNHNDAYSIATNSPIKNKEGEFMISNNHHNNALIVKNSPQTKKDEIILSSVEMRLKHNAKEIVSSLVQDARRYLLEEETFAHSVGDSSTSGISFSKSMKSQAPKCQSLDYTISKDLHRKLGIFRPPGHKAPL